jgi:hypothetical protein
MDRCAECARDICSECRTEVAGKPVCSSCVEAIRSRVAAEIAGEPAAAPVLDPYSQPPLAANAGWATPSSGQTPSPIGQEPPSPSRLLVGIIAGSVVGVIGAFVLKTITFYAQFSLSLFNIFLGIGVGIAVMAGSGRKGPLVAVIAAMLAFGSMLFSDYLLFTSEIAKILGVPVSIGQMPLSAFFEVEKHQGVMHWIIIAIGVYSAFSLCVQRDQPASAP